MLITQSPLCYFSLSGPGDDLNFLLHALHHDWILSVSVEDSIPDVAPGGIFSNKDMSWYQAPAIYPYFANNAIFPSPVDRSQFSTIIETVWQLCKDNNLLKYFLPIDVRLFQ